VPRAACLHERNFSSCIFFPQQSITVFYSTNHKCAYKLTRNGSVQRFVGPEPFFGVSRQNIRRKMKRWMENQHLVMWRGLCSTQRQAGKLISGPDLTTRARLLSFNRTQCRVVIGLLTGHNTLKRHLYTGCPRRNVPDFRRVFLMLKYTDITQNTYVQS